MRPARFYSLFIACSCLSKCLFYSKALTNDPTTDMFRSSSTSAAANLNLRVVTYNVLSSHLASVSSYPTLDPEDLKAENRLPVVLEKLEQQMSKNDGKVVICLQEVSYAWAGVFHTFFAKQGYQLVTGLYGRPFNGYMGVALAWPTSHFETMDVDICRLADEREAGWPREPDKNWAESALSGIQRFWGDTLKKLGLTEKYSDDPPDHWSLSKRRFNVLLTTTLKDKASNKTFSVGTYHMPCAYYCPMAMTLHADLCAQRVRSIANKHEAPFVLAGDFNLKPHEPVYEFLTTGNIDKDSPFYPSPLYGMEWEPTMGDALQSAYAVANGKEPDFTNYAKSGDGEPFIDTLDYIFLSPEWEVKSVLELASREECGGPFPNLGAKEPSDHILIAADVALS